MGYISKKVAAYGQFVLVLISSYPIYIVTYYIRWITTS